ncbi:hypothetical protein ABZ896_10525 [Streptomyces sp. NPDC047072]|uniref:hypothetical protein n=1 Tax=Streptomyces sp. NPDC047072 TaxID=3154809 RepID=UPI0033F358BD
MEAELVTLIGTGATTVVGLMVTDAWEQAKQRVVRLLARGSGEDAVAGELEQSRDALVAAAGTADEEDLTADVTASIRLSLRRLLTQDPALAEELRRLIEELSPAVRQESIVYNTISGGTQNGPVIQGHTFTHLKFGSDR